MDEKTLQTCKKLHEHMIKHSPKPYDYDSEDVNIKRTRLTMSPDLLNFEVCNHSLKEVDDELGVLFCVYCGLVDRALLQSSYSHIDTEQHHPRESQMSETQTKTKPKPKPKPKPKTNFKPEHANAEGLKKIAKKCAIK